MTKCGSIGILVAVATSGAGMRRIPLRCASRCSDRRCVIVRRLCNGHIKIVAAIGRRLPSIPPRTGRSTGRRFHNTVAIIRRVQLRQCDGCCSLAAGASAGQNTGCRGGRLGGNGVTVIVPERRRVGILVAVASDGAGVRGVALRSAGRCCCSINIVMLYYNFCW